MKGGGLPPANTPRPKWNISEALDLHDKRLILKLPQAPSQPLMDSVKVNYKAVYKSSIAVYLSAHSMRRRYVCGGGNPTKEFQGHPFLGKCRKCKRLILPHANTMTAKRRSARLRLEGGGGGERGCNGSAAQKKPPRSQS